MDECAQHGSPYVSTCIVFGFTLALFFKNFLTLCPMIQCRNNNVFWKSMLTYTFVMHDVPVT